MHVDGFRFDLASVFSRNTDGSINFDDPPIFGDIASDPDLAGVRMIAEPWEGNSSYSNYELGKQFQRSFPGIGWRQWNDKFRTTVQHFVKSDPDKVPDLMTRIYGSSDVFPDSLRDAYRAYQSLNYVSSHDGSTLYDLVAYNSPDSWNCGDRDGEAGVSAEVIKLRKRQGKNFCRLLMLSDRTAMVLGGDEVLATPSGHRKPHYPDSPVTWVHLSRPATHPDVCRFFQKMIAFRK